MAPRQQTKPKVEAPPPPRRTQIHPPANDNRARLRVFLLAGGALIVTAAVFGLVKLLG